MKANHVRYVGDDGSTDSPVADVIQIDDQSGSDVVVNERKLELEITSIVKIERYCFLWLTGWSSWIYILHFIGFVNVYIIQHEDSKDIRKLHDFYTINN